MIVNKLYQASFPTTTNPKLQGQKSTTRKKKGKKQTTWKLNNMLLNQWITEEIKDEIKKYLETNENENMIQNQWFAAKAVLRGKFTSLPQETRKKSQTT